jgi:hypothetical protein
MSYIFVAHKPESYDHYKGNTQEYYGDTVIQYDLDNERLYDHWVWAVRTNLSLQFNEKGYQLYIFKDGTPYYIDDCMTFDGKEDSVFCAIELRTKEMALLLIEEQKKLEEEKVVAQKLSDEKRNEELNRALYEALRKKFENT